MLTRTAGQPLEDRSYAFSRRTFPSIVVTSDVVMYNFARFIGEDDWLSFSSGAAGHCLGEESKSQPCW